MQSSTIHTAVCHSQQASSSNSKFRLTLCLGLMALSGLALPTSAEAQAKAVQEKPQAKAVVQEQSAPVGTTTLTTTADDVSTTVAKHPATASTVTLSRTSVLIGSFTIFMLAVFVGFEIITKVPPTLHTPLMSGSNAISGITVVGAILTAGAAAATSGAWFGALLGMVAAVLAMINVVGGFMVTHRMLMMFKKR